MSLQAHPGRRHWFCMLLTSRCRIRLLLVGSVYSTLVSRLLTGSTALRHLAACLRTTTLRSTGSAAASLFATVSRRSPRRFLEPAVVEELALGRDGSCQQCRQRLASPVGPLVHGDGGLWRRRLESLAEAWVHVGVGGSSHPWQLPEGGDRERREREMSVSNPKLYIYIYGWEEIDHWVYFGFENLGSMPYQTSVSESQFIETNTLTQLPP